MTVHGRFYGLAIFRCKTIDKSAPQTFEPNRSRSRISLGVPDVAVPQVILNQSRVAPLVRERKAATVPQHVRMNFDRQAGALSNLRTEIVEHLAGQRSAFGQEQ